MTTAAINTRLEELRRLYIEQPDKREAILAEGKTLKDELRRRTTYPCRVCRQPASDESDHYPFCSKDCHEIWAGENMPTVPSTLKQAQARALEIAKELREKKQRSQFGGGA